MDFMQEFSVPVIVGICLCVGYVIKMWLPDVDNKWIPTIVMLLGMGLAVWIGVSKGEAVTPGLLLSGMVSGLASTGLHQAFKTALSGGDKKGD